MLADGVWIGVEFKKPIGSHDGAVKGERYFTCKKGHGLMVRESQVQVWQKRITCRCLIVWSSLTWFINSHLTHRIKHLPVLEAP